MAAFEHVSMKIDDIYKVGLRNKFIRLSFISSFIDIKMEAWSIYIYQKLIN